MKNTGFYKVFKNNGSLVYKWVYITQHNGKQRVIKARNLKDLEINVRFSGFKWEITDSNLAIKSIEEDNLSNFSQSGFLNVSKIEKSNQYHWVYTYENVKENNIYAESLDELEKLVSDKNLEWKITNPQLAKDSLKYDDDLKKKNQIQKRDSKFHELDESRKEKQEEINRVRKAIALDRKTTKTGFFAVSKVEEKGGYWRYDFDDESFFAKTIKKLEIKVKNEHLPWVITDYDLAKESLKDNLDIVTSEKIRKNEDKKKSENILSEIKKEEALKLKKQKELEKLLSNSPSDDINKLKRY